MTLRGRKIICLDTGEVFDTRKDVLKIHPDAKYATQVCDGKRQTAGGHRWVWAKFEEEEKET